jgi:tRNA threonylcarbamoyladenosine biosynthesis protein TsaB
MALILALETSADICAAALVRDGAVLGARRQPMTRGHAEALVPMVQDIAGVAGISLSDIEIIGVTRGPGSFTGVRTGIAAARGFALAAGATAVGVSSLAAVACAAAREIARPMPILCVLDTRRVDYFVQLFDESGDACTPADVMEAAKIFELIGTEGPVLAGNAVPRLLSQFPGDPGFIRRAPGDGQPDPVDVAVIAEAILNKEGVASDTLSPLYLRLPEVKLPADGGRLKS